MKGSRKKCSAPEKGIRAAAYSASLSLEMEQKITEALVSFGQGLGLEAPGGVLWGHDPGEQ